jgi:homoserine dehydrogenase
VKEVKIGIIGFGTVGAGVVSCLLENGDVIARRTGVRLVLSRIADIDVKTDRKVNVPNEILTTDAMKLIDEVDVVVELVGGTNKAKEFILAALKKGKPVVTANKALLAEYGEEIFAAAEKSKADIYYEASVCGGIPIIKALKEGLVSNKIQKIIGIMNGTCNYILTRMEKERIGFEDVLKEAQKLGYAEANPSFDIDGVDTAHKTAILASLAYGEWFGMKPIHVQGIRGIHLCDISFAAELGYRLKLLGIIKQEEDDVEIRVHPTLIPSSSLLANISDVFNGVMVKGSPVGETLFYGRGAGRNATASAVVADLVDVALNLKFGSHRRVPAFTIGRQFRQILPMQEIMSRYYMRIQVLDKPGVVAKISTVIGNKGISISSLRQLEGQSADNVSLLIMTHMAKEQSLNDAVAEMEKLDCVRNKITLIHVEDI